ncbi:hypothetical protein NE237_008359 [Protea cynaroides]|uniref:Exonuclease domain-containing protein n=1 Tax=Protea cynaroides TaxID=273540 RepID=A0A9Q0QZL8_9MAGN|nr:hypothetical protein NE237_008359 [Protea cynaroides]
MRVPSSRVKEWLRSQSLRGGQAFAILEFGAILVCPRKLVELESYSTLVKPADLSSISATSIQCNGITRDTVACAPTFREVVDDIFDLFYGFPSLFLYLAWLILLARRSHLSSAAKGASFVKMVRISVLNDALKSMYNAEKRGKRQVMIRPSSKVSIKFLLVMQKHGYIGEFEYVDDHRSGKIVVELNGRLNKCGVISPRFDVAVADIENWTARLLPSRQFGYIVLTTSAGIMDHEEARRKNVGGKVLGFFY